MLFSLNTAYVMAHFDFKIVWRPLSQIDYLNLFKPIKNLPLRFKYVG